MEDFLRSLIGWTNDTAVKTVLLFVGGLILKKWEPFVNKAVAFALLLASAVTATLGALFPGVGHGLVPAGFVYATVAGFPLEAASSGPARLGSWAWNTLAPVAFAIATHSGPKNTAQWIQLGVGLFWPGGRPPR